MDICSPGLYSVPAGIMLPHAPSVIGCTSVAPRLERTLPGSESEEGQYDSFNLIFVVGFAILITVLARYLSGRGRKK